MRMNTTIRLLCSVAYLSIGVLPSQAADVKVLYRANSGVIVYDSSTAPGQAANPGTGTGTGTGGTTTSPLAVPVPTAGLAVASGGTWNVVVTPTGGKGPYTFVVTGAPAGVGQVDDGASITLNGVAAAGSYPISVAATDKDGTRVQTSFTVVVAAPVAAGHRYWRVGVTRTHSGAKVYMNEITFFNGATNVPVTGSNAMSGNVDNIQNSFDGVLVSYGTSSAAPSAANPAYYGYAFAAPTTVTDVGIVPYADNDDPAEIFLQYSDDGTTWSTRVNHTDIPKWTGRTVVKFSASVPSGTPVDPNPFSGTYGLANASIYAPVGKESVFDFGTYTGNTTGITCNHATTSMKLSCRFENGKMLLVANPVSPQADYDSMVIKKNGVEIARSSGFNYRAGAADYANANVTTLAPRSATASFTSPPEKIYLPIGRAASIRIGTYTGGEGGHLCSTYAGSLPGGVSCAAANGEIRIVGTPTGSFVDTAYHTLVRDGRVIGSSTGYVEVASGTTDYKNNDATFDAPRSASASFQAGPFVTPIGTPVNILVGTYSGAGADAGYLCRPSGGSLPSGITCSASGGELRLVGTATSYAYDSMFLKLVRDGLQVGATTGYVYVSTQ